LLPVLFVFKPRRLVSFFFAIFVWEMRLLGVLTLKVNNKNSLKNLRSKIIVANHPSLLDVVLLISLLPNADCIVNGLLGKRNMLQVIVNTLYISNELDFAEISKRAANSLSNGNCIIIFPEGTRSIPGKPIDLKKGAARLAIETGYDIVPVHIGGNEKIGLRKHDALFSFHPTQRYHYVFNILPPISIDEYKQMPSGMASKQLTEKIKEQISGV
jgi:1-acyl-sn-glycerol-3-phosphate acyltransferase